MLSVLLYRAAVAIGFCRLYVEVTHFKYLKIDLLMQTIWSCF